MAVGEKVLSETIGDKIIADMNMLSAHQVVNCEVNGWYKKG